MTKAAMKINVNICLGSSCFSRRSKNTLESLQDYIDKNSLNDIVELKGSLCKNDCKNGPNITINGRNFGKIDPASAIDILKSHLDMAK